ncbi:hypothetical protein SESBI_42209 [Sesbania bispinosa]|nr:hypothetical protein SESBI_42209 [Sesbania bispinosa]
MIVVEWGTSEIDFALGGLKRSHRCSIRTERNLKRTFGLGLHAGVVCEVTKPEPNPEVELDIDRESPNLFVFVKLIVIEHHHALARENSTHAVGALGVLEVGPPRHDHVCCGEIRALIESVGFRHIVADLELFVWVADSEVDDEVVAEGVAGCVVELGEFGLCHVIFEGAGLDEDPQDEDHDANEDDDGDQKPPQDAKEAATA